MLYTKAEARCDKLCDKLAMKLNHGGTKLTTLATVNFLSTEIGTKYQREVPLFLKITKFSQSTVKVKLKEICAKNQLN